ncbi:MAG: glycoside hydrolase family 2 protein [bacterium]|nr:glycoside hydrolase family 2 protein [bacterium]
MMDRSVLFVCVLIGLSLFFSTGCFQKSKDSPQTVIEINDGWQFRQKETTDKWRNATVPGCIHTDLIAHNLLENPFYRDNEKKSQWVEQKEWEYKTHFNVDGNLLDKEHIELVFNGLDTYTKIFLNDTLLMETDNMFRQWRADVKPLLKKKDNVLYIHFLSPVTEARRLWEQLGYELPGGPKVMTRKPGYHYGWDWGPKLTTSGIWRPVVLQAWDNAEIRSLQLVQEKVTQKNALVTAIFEIQSPSRQYVEVRIINREHKGKSKIMNTVSTALEPGMNRVSFTIRFKEPKLWWTNGLGTPHLYHLAGIVKSRNRVMDKISQRIGLRNLEVVNEKDKQGENFYFKLNGVPLFIKGANYIPQDNFLSRVTVDRYKKLINSAKDAHMNMLRVWGGGFYENDVFYDLCDQAGILVWQDFMFACAMYPGGKAFQENVRLEAIDNVKRLRNHPCIAMWCGNNEVDEAWHNWGWQSQFSEDRKQRIWEDYQKLFHEILPGVVKQYDGGRFYWPSSPKFGRGNPRSLTEGDSHYWGVWHDAEHFEVFKEKGGRFQSEYGFQAFPPMETVKKFALPEDYSIDSEVMKVHQKHPRGNQLIKTYMERDYHIPESFEHFLYVSGVLQAEGMKTGIEALRRAKPFCMGSLYWQLNDCWPVVSWSSIDYYGNWKALHYFVKKAYRDVLVSPVEEDGKLKVYIISDKTEPLKGKLSLRLLDLSGRVLWEKGIEAAVEANGGRVVFETEAAAFLGDRNKGNLVLEAVFRWGEKDISSALYYFVKPKDLKLAAPVIKKSVEAVDEGFSITLSCEQLAKNVYLTVEGEEGFFTDNYFDLVPGTGVTVQFITGKKVDRFAERLKIITLKDTMEGGKIGDKKSSQSVDKNDH